MSRHDERPNDGQHNERRRRRRRRRHYSGSFFCVSCNWILIALLGEEEDNIICDNYYNSFRDKNEEQRGKRIKITTDQERFFWGMQCFQLLFCISVGLAEWVVWVDTMKASEWISLIMHNPKVFGNSRSSWLRGDFLDISGWTKKQSQWWWWQEIRRKRRRKRGATLRESFDNCTWRRRRQLS